MGLFSKLVSTLTGGDVLGVAANIFGNIMGASNNSAANRTNLQIAQMNNEFNERMLEKQLAYNWKALMQEQAYDTEKWQGQTASNLRNNLFLQRDAQAYNSAVAQRIRLEAAGLNPYMMMDGGSAGTSGTASASAGAGGSPSAKGINPPTATPVQVQPYIPDITGITDILGRLMDIEAMKGVRGAQERNLDSDTQGKNITNLYLGGKHQADIEYTRALTGKAITENGRMQALLPYEINSMNNQLLLIMAQRSKLMLESHLTEKELKYFDSNMIADLQVKAAQYYSLMKAGYLSEKQARLAVNMAAKVAAETTGINAANKYADSVAFWSWYTTKQNAIKSNWDAASAKQIYDINDKTLRQMGSDYWNPFRYVGTLLSGAGTALIKR